MAEKKRLQVFFWGRVQGVGFRATADRMAEEFEVSGFVRNLPDGRVELIAEGEEIELEKFLQKIRKSFLSRYVDGLEVHWLEAVGEFEKFEIGY